MNHFVNVFGRVKPVITGMVHLRALPGSPKCSKSLEEITKIACEETLIYKNANVDAVLLENMHDIPWCLPHQMGPETTACMTRIATAVRQKLPNMPVGIQVLSAANKEALAVAKASGLNFIRAEGFVYSHIGDEGQINSCAAEIIRYRQSIKADNVLIFTDIKKKHSSHAITGDVTLAETAKAAELFLSDGLIITGTTTGDPAKPEHLKEVQESVSIPVLIGSGVNDENLTHYMSANGIIVGSSLKMKGIWSEDLDNIRVHHFMKKVQKHRDKETRSTPNIQTEDTGHRFIDIHSEGG